MARQMLYFGGTEIESILPHELDYLNSAIQVGPGIQKAVGDIDVTLYLSGLGDSPAGNVIVNFFWGMPNQQATWFDPGHCIGTWSLDFCQGLPPCIPAPVDNCIWKQDIRWSTHKLRIHNRRFALIATVRCDEVGLGPTLTVPASDPCVAVRNSLLVE